MNWKHIGIAGGILFAIVIKAIDHAANRNYESIADQRAMDEVPEDTLNRIEAAKDSISLADEVSKREHKELFDGMRIWKIENDYDQKIETAHSANVSELNDFKLSINYDDRKAEIEEAYEDAIESFKDSIDYDYELSLQESIIEDAKAAYKKRCKKIDEASGSDEEITDALKDLKKNEKEKAEEIISEAKGKISELKSKLSAEENKLNRKKQAELRTLNNELQPTKSRLDKAESETCSALQAEKAKAENALREEIKAKRTEEENQALAKRSELTDFISQNKLEVASNGKEIYKNAPTSEKWAAYFKEVKFPKWAVVCLSVVPLVPVGFGIKKYALFIYEIVKAM